jgi:hypothetical protein
MAFTIASSIRHAVIRTQIIVHHPFEASAAALIRNS